MFTKINIPCIRLLQKLITQKSPESASPENEILSLSWCISKSFYRISVVEVSKSKLMNRPPESKDIEAINQKGYCSIRCQTRVLFGSPGSTRL